MHISVAFLEKIVQIVRIVKGEPCVIQAQNSLVKLHVPKGVHGAVFGNIHTIHSKFLHLIPDSECIVGPMCEYSVHPFIQGPQVPSHEQFQLQIPQILGQKAVQQKKIRVRYSNNANTVVATFRADDESSQVTPDLAFNVDRKYVNILTCNLGSFMVTADALTCCARSVVAHVYGSQMNVQNSSPPTTMKVHVSSALYDLQDYEDVSTHMLVSLQRHQSSI